MTKPVTISFYGTEELRNRLERTAQEQRRSVSNLLRMLIDKHIPAVEPAPTCPACDGTRAFPQDGVWYCPDCGEKIVPVNNGNSSPAESLS